MPKRGHVRFRYASVVSRLAAVASLSSSDTYCKVTGFITSATSHVLLKAMRMERATSRETTTISDRTSLG